MKSILLAIILVLFSCDSTRNSKETGLEARNPITYEYVENGTDKQVLDYFENKDTDEIKPVLLWLHGGAWLVGSKENVDEIAFEVAQEGGYHLISAGYRFVNDDAAPWPSTIQDVKTVIRWIKKNAIDLKIDPNRIIISGMSAGAHLATLASASDDPTHEGNLYSEYTSDVYATISFAGVFDFKNAIEDATRDFGANGCPLKKNILIAVALLIDCEVPIDLSNPIANCDSLELEKAAALHYVDENTPPVYMMHGKDDCTIPWSQTNRYSEALTQAGVINKLILPLNGVHDSASLNPDATDIVNFINSINTTKRKFALY